MKKFLSNNEHEIYILLIILSTFLPSIYCAFFIVYTTPIIIFRIFIYKYSFLFIKIYIAFILITFLLFISKIQIGVILLLSSLIIITEPVKYIVPLFFTSYLTYVIIKNINLKISQKILIFILVSFVLSFNMKLFILIEDLTKSKKEIKVYEKIKLTTEDTINLEYNNPIIDYGYSLFSSPWISMDFPSPIPNKIFTPRNYEENIEEILDKKMINYKKNTNSDIKLEIISYREGNYLNYQYKLIKNDKLVAEYKNSILKYTLLNDYWNTLKNKDKMYNSPIYNNYIIHLSYLFDNSVWNKIYQFLKIKTYKIYTLNDFIETSIMEHIFKSTSINILNQIEADDSSTFSKEKNRNSIDSCNKINNMFKSVKHDKNTNIFCFERKKLIFSYNELYNKLFITIFNMEDYKNEFYELNLKDFNNYNIWKTIYIYELTNNRISLEFISHNSLKNKDIKNIIEIKLKN